MKVAILGHPAIPSIFDGADGAEADAELTAVLKESKDQS